MEKEYLEVPTDILTEKDLDYLSDMFQWNYGALKSSYSALNTVKDEELLELFEEGVALFDDNINDVLDILSDLGGEANE